MNLLKAYCAVVLFLLTAQTSKAQTPPDTLSAYPNPFANDVFIHFDLETHDTVTLTLFNVIGQAVASIFDHTPLPTGSYQITYNGSALPNGIYFLMLGRTNETYTERLMKQGPTAVHQPVSPGQIFLSPNPTSDFVNVPLVGTKTILIMHPNGLVETIKTSETKINLSHLHQGVYTVSVLDRDNRLVFMQKIIKTP
ncbi:MAG TPA: T9SS type A sorting domain-containing protein [Chitinophagales bacterium]|nr:T9SS type A sorting domain-containing protein [Chitinophagales bacterium]